MYKRYFKRIIDLLAAVVLLSLLWPVLLVGLALAAWDTRSSPFFFHQRPGLNGEPFKVIKLKTMRTAMDADGNPLPNMNRMSALGGWLRRWSIDEVPQLFNVLKGDISLVGPRPLEMRYLPHYSPEQARRHDVMPGITGLAQINGRNSLSWEEKFKLDVQYVEQQSFLLDCRILFATVIKTLSGADVNQSANATVEPFVKR